MPPPPALVRWIVWFALASSLGIYFAMLELGLIQTAEKPADGLALPLTVAGLALALVSVSIRFFVANRRDGDGRRTVPPPWIFAAFIAALALGEAVGVFGFALGLLGHGTKQTLPLFLASLGAMLSNNPAWFFPKTDEETPGNRTYRPDRS
ncbi:MAG TPA: hypothetical protein PLA50_13105 [Bacteroidia bacterium]|nr:hypothetical protein [Bacteroidia bacterium]